MPNTVTHKTLSSAQAATNPLLIGGPEQNEEHLFSGGADGAIAVRDISKSDGIDWLVPVANGQVLASTLVATRPAWTAAPLLTSLTLLNPLTPANGGTGISVYALGDFLVASAAQTLAKLPAVAIGAVMASAGVSVTPVWSTTPKIAGTLSVGTTNAVAGAALVVSGGALVFENDNTNTIGQSLARRPSIAHLATAVVLGGAPAAAGYVRVTNAGGINSRNFANSGDAVLCVMDASDVVNLGDNSFATKLRGTTIQWGPALVALGGGSAPALGTIGGAGPATAAQNGWMKALDSTGAAIYIAVWK